MKVYNINKTQILEDYDLNKGYLKEDVIVIHHDEIKEVKEVGHYEVKQVYPNGGKDVEWVVDIKGQEYTPAYTQEEKIQIYIPYTISQLQKNEAKTKIEQLKKYLKDTDYVTNKLAEANAKALISNDYNELRSLLLKYEIVITNRKKYRDEISILELSL